MLYDPSQSRISLVSFYQYLTKYSTRRIFQFSYILPANAAKLPQSHMVFDTFPRITYNIHRNQTIIIESDGIIYVDCRRMEGL